ncbi:MAG: phosphoesterase [Rubinisphaera brasiliensis]|uniref:Phosphoesterase (MutT family)-like protein n=1 Tax=Rubinisphaera brasiliensis (strain ATCC 49424 / DSM 5305 / JCM 21570 / IAM 15109 / NBRC 103401 / IFAM 1448) TaxID=756272 RepID=F0SFB2_RUBBR|nr:phosphoesterase [Rubinisphaera brasiliensis]ADY58267.1 phosphoesterase (MutT family)-like protein [Rubinisphaera brasiliensis DSM 5305]MBR9800958.1 phosphoesterase [bacterium]
MTDPSGVEHVLVVPTMLFHELGHFQGFNPNVEPYLKTLIDPAHTSYRPRDEMEQDPSFKQLIPYCLFMCDGNVFHYLRGSSQGESRLHSKRSLGVGGHISTLDVSDEDHAYILGMKREIEEEVEVGANYQQRLVGLLNDDLTEVGKVHLGLVHIFELDQPKVSPREASMMETGFSSPADLLEELDQFETWSQICLESLFDESGRLKN